MKRYMTVGAGLMLMFAVIGFSSRITPARAAAAESHEADVKAIHDIETQWNKDIAAKDAAKSTAHYADDGVLMLPYAAPSIGRQAIRQYMDKLLADPVLQLHFQATKVDVANSGELAYARGTYKMVYTDEMVKKPVNDHGAYLAIYRKQPDGTWKVIENIVNSEQVNAPTRQMFPGTEH